MSAMKADKRRERLLRLVRSNPSISIARVAETLEASRETIRKDLIQLEKEGLIRRDRGRVILVGHGPSFLGMAKKGALSRDQRQNEILGLLKERQGVRNQEIAAFLNVSPGTIRNDLLRLEREGRIKRRHGSAVPDGTDRTAALLSLWLESPFPASVRNIGERAISLIERGDLVFLDDSVFSLYIAANLPLDREAGVLTHSLQTALLLSCREYRADVFVLPGILQRAEISVDNQFGELISRRFLVTKAFLGFAAYSQGRGFFTANHQQAEVFSLILGIAQSAFLLIDSANVGRSGKYGFTLEGRSELVRETLVDDGLTVQRAALEFPEELPVVLCGENYADKSPFNKQYTIGFATLHGKSEFSQLVREGIESAVRKHSNIELVVADNRMDRRTTLVNIDTFIEKKVDLVIEYQHDHSLSTLIGEKLSHAGIPIIAVDIPIPGSIYFGAHNYRAGLIGGEAAVQEVKRIWNGIVDNLIVMTDVAAGPLVESRITGMLESFCKEIPFPEERLVYLDSGNDPHIVKRLLVESLSRVPAEAKTMVFSINSNVTIGILDAIAYLNRQQFTLVVGQNITPRISRELEREGTPLLGSVGFSPDRYGERIVKLAMGILEKKEVSPNNYTEHKWIGRSRPHQQGDADDN